MAQTDVQKALARFMELYQDGEMDPYKARDIVLSEFENDAGPWAIEEDVQPEEDLPFVAISYDEHPEVKDMSAAETVAWLLNEKNPDKHYRVENGAVVADEPSDEAVDGQETPGASGGGR